MTDIEIILDYLNQKSSSHYRASTKKNVTLIKARLKEGFTVDDFKTVIDKKCAEWIGTEYEKYLRPETLFGNKFEGYLNQHITIVPHTETASEPEQKPKKNQGSFDTDDFFEMALRRSYGDKFNESLTH